MLILQALVVKKANIKPKLLTKADIKIFSTAFSDLDINQDINFYINLRLIFEENFLLNFL